ncbi:hypothetical protein Celaphus_00002916 [Cervus elaphus hippelaphus]|uniref:Uncharacterized protein n=1 Tax=Cervus elaphus hippelaphus TaxID=46360 RepID=A0A212D2H0_CEREH|nr:hypothetical protein Celaphus_00002916 [Cervus elaphus hippelaphus]
MVMHLPSSAPPGPDTILMPDPGRLKSHTAAAPPPAPAEIIEPPFQQAPIPAEGASGHRPQHSASAGPPRLYPPLPALSWVLPKVPPELEPISRQAPYEKAQSHPATKSVCLMLGLRPLGK